MDPDRLLGGGGGGCSRAACGSGALIATGSTGYRVCTDDTWAWDPAPIASAWCGFSKNLRRGFRLILRLVLVYLDLFESIWTYLDVSGDLRMTKTARGRSRIRRLILVCRHDDVS